MPTKGQLVSSATQQLYHGLLIVAASGLAGDARSIFTVGFIQ